MRMEFLQYLSASTERLKINWENYMGIVFRFIFFSIHDYTKIKLEIGIKVFNKINIYILKFFYMTTVLH